MVSGESVWLRQRNLTGPSCEEPTPSRRYFIKRLLCFKGHVESSGWRSGGQAIHSLTLTTGAFLIGGRRGEQPPSSLTFPKQRLGFSPVVTSVNFISGGDLEGLGLKSTPSFWFSPFNDFHRVQDLNGGEIMSASHYCKLYPLLRPSLNS